MQHVFVSPLLHLHINEHEILSDVQEQFCDGHGWLDEHVHFIMQRTSLGAGSTPSGIPTGMRTRWRISLTQPYISASNFGGSGSIAEYQISACI